MRKEQPYAVDFWSWLHWPSQDTFDAIMLLIFAAFGFVAIGGLI